MKRMFIIVGAAALMALAGASCELLPLDDSSDSTSIKSSNQSWDVMFMLNEGEQPCPGGFVGRGASTEVPGMSLPSLGAAYFPGLLVSHSDLEDKGGVPEVTILAYTEVPQMGINAALLQNGYVVNAGDPVSVSFTYQAMADGANGDYFLARIIDGDRFLVPVQARGATMAEGAVRTVSYSYVAQADGFMMEMIVGLGDPGDQFYLDDVVVRAGNTTVMVDDFEDMLTQTNMPPYGMMRLPFLPMTGAGSLAPVQPGLVVGSTTAVMLQGGQNFGLYGQGGSSGGYSGKILIFDDSLAPFYGYSQLMGMGNSFMGVYQGYDDTISTTCEENGQALVSVNPSGNADLSGVWQLTVQGTCQDGSVLYEMVGDTVVPNYLGEDITVQKVLLFFVGLTFQTASGASMDTYGLTLGNSGLFVMDSGATQVQLIGSYNKSTGVFAGQLMGAWPTASGACVFPGGENPADFGQFMAVVDGNPLIPLPPPP